MKRTIFILGRETAIAEAEIHALLHRLAPESDLTFTRLGDALQIEHKTDLPTEHLARELGGTQYIAESIIEDEKFTPLENIQSHITTHAGEGKTLFTLLPPLTERDGLTIKKYLREHAVRARFIPYHNTATILHNNLRTEGGAYLIRGNTAYRINQIQDFESFATRDMEKPRRNAKRGMLPPKLARILINLSLIEKHHTLLDPFCGSGTLLMEAAEIGVTHICGSDKSPDAVYDSQQNMGWLSEHGTPIEDCKIRTADATELSRFMPKESVDRIATEPYMGRPCTGRETFDELQKNAHELQSLYKKTLQECAAILQNNGILVMTFPCFAHSKKPIETWSKELIAKLPFSVLPLLPKEDTLLYNRPDQFVARRIVRLQKK